MTTATMIYVMNQKKYDSLPDDLKKVIDANSGREFSAWVAAQHVAADAVGRDMTIARGNKVYSIPADEMTRWEQAAKPVTAEWIKEVTASGADGQKLYDDAVALVAKYSAAR